MTPWRSSSAVPTAFNHLWYVLLLPVSQILCTTNPANRKWQTVDWNNGKAVAGDNQSEILKLLSQLPK